MRTSSRAGRSPREYRAVAATPVEPAPDFDLQTSFAVARIEADPSRPTGRMLFLDDMEASYVDLADPLHLEFGYVRRVGDVVDLLRPARAPLSVLHVGGGGFTLPRYVAATRPRSRQVVFEKDAGLVQVARRFLGLRTSPGMRVRIGDARQRIGEVPDSSVDLVIGDAFDGVVVPIQLATAEWLAEVRRVLRPGGVYVVNVIDCPPLRTSRAEAATVLAAFRSVALVAGHDLLRERDAGNVVLLGSDRPLPLPELTRAAARGPFPDDVLDRPATFTFSRGARPLTDADSDRWRAAAPPPDLPVPIEAPRLDADPRPAAPDPEPAGEAGAPARLLGS